jgi:hypothetical protein
VTEREEVRAQVAQLRAMIDQLREINQAQVEQDQGLGDLQDGTLLRIDELEERVRALESGE